MRRVDSGQLLSPIHIKKERASSMMDENLESAKILESKRSNDFR